MSFAEMSCILSVILGHCHLRIRLVIDMSKAEDAQEAEVRDCPEAGSTVGTAQFPQLQEKMWIALLPHQPFQAS